MTNPNPSRMSDDAIMEVTHFAVEFVRRLESLNIPEIDILIVHFLEEYMTERLGVATFLGLDALNKAWERSASERTGEGDK